MTELFTYNFDAGNRIFKGVQKSDTYSLNYNTPSWFSQNMSVAIKYGNGDKKDKHIKLLTLTNQRKLKLININSWIFSFNFMDKLNLYYDELGIDTQNIVIEKHKASMSLGLPNDHIHNILMNTYYPDLKIEMDPNTRMDTIIKTRINLDKDTVLPNLTKPW